jgi:hypothetical protein
MIGQKAATRMPRLSHFWVVHALAPASVCPCLRPCARACSRMQVVGQLDILAQTIALLEQRLTISEAKNVQVLCTIV